MAAPSLLSGAPGRLHRRGRQGRCRQGGGRRVHGEEGDRPVRRRQSAARRAGDPGLHGRWRHAGRTGGDHAGRLDLDRFLRLHGRVPVRPVRCSERRRLRLLQRARHLSLRRQRGAQGVRRRGPESLRHGSAAHHRRALPPPVRWARRAGRRSASERAAQHGRVRRPDRSLSAGAPFGDYPERDLRSGLSEGAGSERHDHDPGAGRVERGGRRAPARRSRRGSRRRGSGADALDLVALRCRERRDLRARRRRDAGRHHALHDRPVGRAGRQAHHAGGNHPADGREWRLSRRHTGHGPAIPDLRRPERILDLGQSGRLVQGDRAIGRYRQFEEHPLDDPAQSHRRSRLHDHQLFPELVDGLSVRSARTPTALRLLHAVHAGHQRLQGTGWRG